MIYRDTDELQTDINSVMTACQKPGPAVQAEITSILWALTKIALFIECAEPSLDDEEYEGLIPESDFQATKKLIETRFPNWGRYNQCYDISINIADTSVVVGVATDDLTGIVCDLIQVLWVFDNQSPANAIWHLHDSYMFNWREHLLNLKLFEHARFNER